MNRIVGDHNWTCIVCHKPLCKLDIIPFKDTILHTKSSCWISNRFSFWSLVVGQNWILLKLKPILWERHCRLLCFSAKYYKQDSISQGNRCSRLHTQLLKEMNLPDSLLFMQHVSLAKIQAEIISGFCISR